MTCTTGNGPAQERQAFATSCEAPQWSSGQNADPSCIRRGLWAGPGRNAGLQRSTVGARQYRHAALSIYNAYLLLNVVERVGRVDGEADEDNVRVGV
jgi:hypothetical protein